MKQDGGDRLGTDGNQDDGDPTTPVQPTQFGNAAKEEGEEEEANQRILDDHNLRRLQMADRLRPEACIGGPHRRRNGDQHHREAVDKTDPSGLRCRLGPDRRDGHRHYSFGRRGSNRAHSGCAPRVLFHPDCTVGPGVGLRLHRVMRRRALAGFTADQGVTPLPRRPFTRIAARALRSLAGWLGDAVDASPSRLALDVFGFRVFGFRADELIRILVDDDQERPLSVDARVSAGARDDAETALADRVRIRVRKRDPVEVREDRTAPVPHELLVTRQARPVGASDWDKTDVLDVRGAGVLEPTRHDESPGSRGWSGPLEVETDEHAVLVVALGGERYLRRSHHSDGAGRPNELDDLAPTDCAFLHFSLLERKIETPRLAPILTRYGGIRTESMTAPPATNVLSGARRETPWRRRRRAPRGSAHSPSLTH